MKTWDVIVIGGGIIGLCVARELRRKSARVLLLERGEPGREASHAAGGMIADCPLEIPNELQALAEASARIYPEFVNQLQIESGQNVDLRAQGAILFGASSHLYSDPLFAAAHPLPAPLAELELALAPTSLAALFLAERSVDPRALTSAALASARHLGVDISTGEKVTAVNVSNGRVTGVTARKTIYIAAKVVNCAGAWSGQIAPHAFPTRPVKGQMLCLLSPQPELLRHVVRWPELYLIPRSDGRIIIGATVEEAGFDRRTDLETIQRLHRAAVAAVPALHNAKILESWAGLRPGTPDFLPILGATETPGYFVATGHFRDGILLAPITAQIMAQIVEGSACGQDLSSFSPQRFGRQQVA